MHQLPWIYAACAEDLQVGSMGGMLHSGSWLLFLNGAPVLSHV